MALLQPIILDVQHPREPSRALEFTIPDKVSVEIMHSRQVNRSCTPWVQKVVTEATGCGWTINSDLGLDYYGVLCDSRMYKLLYANRRPVSEFSRYRQNPINSRINTRLILFHCISSDLCPSHSLWIYMSLYRDYS